MGDRGHIHLHEGDNSGVYLYTHSHGTELPSVVQAALRDGKNSWDDAPYLNRMIFSRLIASDVLGELGFGLDVNPSDIGDGGRFVDVDHSVQCVTLLGENFDPVTYTFDEYVKLTAADVCWPNY